MKFALYQPDIAQNLGAAMRLAACFNVELSVIEPCGFPLTSKAIRRVAMDYANKTRLKRFINWQNFKQETQNQHRIVLLSTKAAKPITEFSFRPDDMLLFGSESEGVPDFVHKEVDARVFIPLSPNTRSLNLASSASIALFEALRQTGQL